MKRTVPWLCVLLVGLFTSSLFGQQSAANSPKVYDVDSMWPGVKFEIAGVLRIDPENVNIVVQVIANGSQGPTFIGFEKKTEIDPKKPSPPPMPGTPFSLMSASIIDQTTKIQYGTIPQVPGRPSYGPSSILTTINSGCWFQMSVQFKLPMLPPNPDGTLPVQKIQVTLPQAKKPIPDVIVPRK